MQMHGHTVTNALSMTMAPLREEHEKIDGLLCCFVDGVSMQTPLSVRFVQAVA